MNGHNAIKHMLENIRQRIGVMRRLRHGSMSASRTPYEAMAFSFCLPPKEEGRLGEVASCGGRSIGYLGRGCAWIEKGQRAT
jgi:hypothetical protein